MVPSVEIPNVRILVVDDQAEFRSRFRSLLEEHEHWQVIAEAENGKSAIELAKELHPDIIFMDISMPGINGIEAARIIHHDFSQIKIIIVTNHANQKLIQKSLQSGASGYLLKNSVTNDIAIAMEKVLNHQVFISDHKG